MGDERGSSLSVGTAGAMVVMVPRGLVALKALELVSGSLFVHL